MQLKPGTFCPLLKKECVQMQCNWFIQVRGFDHNSGKEVDEWGCSIAWLPHLLIENANQARQAGAATESFRNEYVKTADATIKTMIAIATQPPPANNPNENPMRIVYDDKTDNSKG